MRVLWLLSWCLVLTPAVAAQNRVIVVELADSIQPASLRYVERALQLAQDDDATLIVIQLDTPGGLLSSTRAMTSAILRSPIPVVVYVAPSGARGASAGFFLLLAADVAVMAPGTNAGAAHPVDIGGQSDSDNVSTNKAVEDAAAFARALAALRGRPADSAAQAVTHSRSYSAEEARELGLIEHIATSRDALLSQLDGLTVTRPDGTSERLTLDGAEVVVVQRTFAERALSVIADPQVAYLLLMVGALALMIELMSPGLIIPGIAGALSILVALYGLSLLPVNWVGAVLLAAGMGLMIAEVFVSSFGLLAVGGLISITIGSLMLVDAPIPDLQIGLDVVGPVVLVVAVLAAILVVRSFRTRALRPLTGLDAMTGEIGEVIKDIDEHSPGTVFVHGEYWTAIADRTVAAGTKVAIERIEAGTLRVAPVDRVKEGDVR